MTAEKVCPAFAVSALIGSLFRTLSLVPLGMVRKTSLAGGAAGLGEAGDGEGFGLASYAAVEAGLDEATLEGALAGSGAALPYCTELT